MISKYPTCLTYRNRQPSETPIKTEIPDNPWTKCAADLFRLQGHYYLLIVDYYLKFIAVKNLQNPLSETVINKCKKVFSQFARIFRSQISFIFKNLGHSTQND